MSDDTALALTEPQALGPILPLATPEAMTAAMQAYEALKRAVLSEADEQEITVRGKKRKFIKRSGWRRLSIAFGVSTTILDRKIIAGPEGRTLSAEFTIRATAPNGRYADGWGACSAWEERFQGDQGRQKMEHDIPATAETRAENRACANLFGYGETSAEEMDNSPEVNRPTCPSCGKPVRQSTYNENEWFCWTKQGGCGWKGSTPVTAEPTSVTTDGEIINPSPQSRAAAQQASDERPGTREVGTPASPVERVAPPATTPAPAEPNGKRRGRPLGSKNHKAQAAPIPFGGTEAEPVDTLTPLRRDLFAVASRLLKLQYIEKASDLPPSERWEAEVNKTLGVYITRKRGTDVALDDLEEDSLRECIAELQGFVDTMMGDGPDPDAEPQLAEPEQVIPVPQHKPIVRNAVAAPRRSPANELTQIDPQAALARARALADLRNRTTALLATREGLIQLTAKDEDRLRLQADTVMEKVAQNAFQVAIKNLDTEQLELLVERAKAASAPQ